MSLSTRRSRAVTIGSKRPHVTGPQITVALNDLVRQGVLASWHRSARRVERHWVLVPPVGPSTRYTRDGVVDYLEFAAQARRMTDT